MNKTPLILKYFQHADQLTIKNKNYCKILDSLFNWLLQNDKVDNDLTSSLFDLSIKQRACIISHEEATIAGIEELSFLLSHQTKLLFKPVIHDGQRVIKDQIIAEIEGNVSEILIFERTILNILQRMSGIATETNKILHSFPPIAATRKTPWGLLDKKAVSAGGGLTHRLSLADGILIKDNHLAAIKKQYRLTTIEEAIEKALELSFGDLIEIEVKTFSQTHMAIETFNKFNTSNNLAVMFDNFSPAQIKSTIRKLSQFFDLSTIIFEASGGINEKNLKDFAQTGVDFISLGSLTHSPKAANFSLEI